MTDTEQARALIDANQYLTLATADAEGNPWASPVWFAHESYTSFLWVSHPEFAALRQHRGASSRRHGRLRHHRCPEPGACGLPRARAAEVDAAELEDALAVYSDKSMRSGLIAWTRPDVTGDAAHRMYRARISAASVLAPKDSRAPISL